MTLALSAVQLTSQLSLMGRFVRQVFPRVDEQLNHWRNLAGQCPQPMLATQAKASIGTKRFHAQGGSVYALYPGVNPATFTRFVVALQTISDYLDNLCDRAGIEDEQGFRQLHLAMLHALAPDSPSEDYYSYYPYSGDGGYLNSLVQECRQRLRELPKYSLVQEEVCRMAGLYSELQTYKHLPLTVRERKMQEWIAPHLEAYPQLSTWEFAAATGSTLGIFALCAAASSPALTTEDVAKLTQAYFPWLGGLHILLDYFIDQEEDRKGGDLNFVFYYRDQKECEQRLTWFMHKALEQINSLPNPLFHLTVLEGLLALYLSDPKTKVEELKSVSHKLLKNGGYRARLMYRMCRVLRWQSRI
ncbi:MAG TPA: tetraprenyl-beta-curcumene synthase family protein [Bacillota bacterium]|nr:tetraprenyl-beta-curcumene synthase family protein [Bacillota bacterium]